MDVTEQSLGQKENYELEDILKEYKGDGQSNDPGSYQIPPKQTAARHSLPTEDEVRAYLASYARGEAEPSFQPRRSVGPEEPVFDRRFLMGEDRQERQSKLRYGGSEVNTAADEAYLPPKAETSISTHAPEPDDDEEIADAPVRPNLFRRLRSKYEQQRAESDRKEAERREEAQRIRYSEPEELILPGETPPDAPAASNAAATEDAASPAVSENTRSSAPKHAAKPTEETQRFTPSWSRHSTDHKEYASVFPDTSASPAIYAEPRQDEDEAYPDDESVPLKPENSFPASFKEYLTTLLTSAFYGMRKGAATILTAEEDDEDLGAEATPAFASRYYGRFVRSQRLRLRICGVLLLVMGWISLGLPVTGQLANIRVAAYFVLVGQLTVMLLCQDVLTGAILNAFHRRIGVDSLAALACLVTSLDALLTGSGKLVSPHMPLCLISSLSLTGLLLASLLSCRGLRKALRVPSIAKRAYTVTGEVNVEQHGTTILKSQRPYTGFVRRSEEAPPDETAFQKLSLPLLLLVALLSLLTVVITGNIKDFIYILSVLLCACAPFCALLCFALPFFNGSLRIFSSGAAIAGWSGLCDVGQSNNLIVTDRDLFPDGTVEIEQVRIFADAKPERIISYAGSMLTACGSCVSKPFADLMERHHCAMRQIESFEYLPGGGMKGVIDSSVILCGSSELMQLMNVRIPFRLINRSSILLAVDGVLYGIFNMKYTADPQVRKALIGLMRSSRHPIFAIRDFNVTPAMLHDCFDVATDGYDFPPYVERFALSSAAPGEDSKVAAVVCRDGLGPLSRMARIGRSMYLAVRTSLRLTEVGVVLGVLFCFFRLVILGGVSVPFLFFFMLLFALPVFFLGTFLNLE